MKEEIIKHISEMYPSATKLAKKREMSKLKIKKAWVFNYNSGKINKVKVKPCGALIIDDDELADYCEDVEIDSIYDRNVFLNKSMAKSYRYRYLLDCIATALDISVGYNITALLEAKSILKRLNTCSLKNLHMDIPVFKYALKGVEQ